MTPDGNAAALLAADVVAWGMLAAAVAVLPTLLVVPAPYGRYGGRSGWGVGIPARLAWMTQEAPSLLIPAAMLTRAAARGRAPTGLQLATLLAFMAHYAWRALAFPLLMRSSRRTPLSVWLLAFVFCCLNGFQQGASCILKRQPSPDSCASTAAPILGLLLWAAGLAVNVHADLTLCRLRKQSAAGYQIPRGGGFRFVSAANYCGEIAEWAGWALACRSLQALAFACFTFANLAPRGHHHHRFYQRTFGAGYPRGRWAVIPFVW